MKRLLLTYAIAATYIGLCSTVMADLTSTQTGSPEPESYGAYTVKHGSEDSDFFGEDWLNWLLDDVFGWDRRHRGSRYYYGHDNLGFGSGDGGWDHDSGDDGWSSDSGNGGWDHDLGDDAWSPDSGNGGWDCDFGADAWSFDSGDGGWGFDYTDTGATDTGPLRHSPAPGAFVLGGIGLALAGWLGNRKKCMT